MFVRCKKRFKDGKEHRCWSVVENVRVRGGRVVQRHVLYLGEINDSHRTAWCCSIEVVEGMSGSPPAPALCAALLLAFLGLLAAIGIAVDGDDLCVVDEAVDQRHDAGGGGEGIPIRLRRLADLNGGGSRSRMRSIP